MTFLEKTWKADYNNDYHAQYFKEEGGKRTYFGEILINVGKISNNNVVEPWKVIPHGWGRLTSGSEIYDGFFLGDRILMCRYEDLDRDDDDDDDDDFIVLSTFCRKAMRYGQLGERMIIGGNNNGIIYYDLGSLNKKTCIPYYLNKEGSEVIRYSHHIFEGNDKQLKYYIIIYQPIPDSDSNTSTVDVLTLQPDEYATIDDNDNITVYSISNTEPLVTISPRPVSTYFSTHDEEYLLQPSVDRMKVKYFIPFPFLCCCDETPCRSVGFNCEDDNERFGENDLPADEDGTYPWYNSSSTSS